MTPERAKELAATLGVWPTAAHIEIALLAIAREDAREAARLVEAEALLQEALDAGIEELWMHTPNGDAYDESAALRGRIAAFIAGDADK